MHPWVAMILAEQGVVATRQYPRLGATLRRLHLAGQLDNPLPGIFTAAGATDPHTWLRAVCTWSAPAGVVTGRSAAAVWSLAVADPVVQLAHPTLRSRRGVRVIHRLIAPEQVVRAGGLRVAAASLAAAELAATDEGRAACEALRLGLASHAELMAATATLAGSRGQRERALVIAACRDNPWSFAELRLHGILRAAGIRGWVANQPVRLGGRTYQPDVRFRSRPVVIEVDGRATHQAPGQFVVDRQRQNEFTMAGFFVVRFAWEQLDDAEYVVRVVREVLRRSGR